MSFERKDYGTPNILSGVIADDLNLILYRPKLNKITGGVTSTILLQQIMYWSKKTNNDFYKFSQPCNHEKYKEGDSWCEELGFSKKEFETAIKRIGFKLGKHKEKNLMKQEEALVIYYIDGKRLTHYSVNWNVVNRLLNEIYLVNTQSGFSNNLNTQSGFTKENTQSELTEVNTQSELTKENTESGFTILSETTTETTTETTDREEVSSDSSLSSSNLLDAFYNTIKQGLTEVAFNTWIKILEFNIEDNKVTITAPNNFSKGIVENRYLELIKENLKLHGITYDCIEVIEKVS